MRIVAFVGSPIEADEKEIIKVAKRLKKEKVNIDIVNFGETVSTQKKLFVDLWCVCACLHIHYMFSKFVICRSN